MATFGAISSFSHSLQRFLDRAYRRSEPALPPVTFAVIGGAWLAATDEPTAEPTVSLYLHRLTPSAHARNSRSSSAPGALVLDLHYLLTVWAASAEKEQRLLGWAMQQLHHHAAFDSSVLSGDGGWEPAEAVSIFPVDMATDELARIFESVRRPVRLSWPFIARVVRIQNRADEGEWPAVVVRRAEFGPPAAKEGA